MDVPLLFAQLFDLFFFLSSPSSSSLFFHLPHFSSCFFFLRPSTVVDDLLRCRSTSSSLSRRDANVVMATPADQIRSARVCMNFTIVRVVTIVPETVLNAKKSSSFLAKKDRRTVRLDVQERVAKEHLALKNKNVPSREIAGKTHTFWFDWGPAGERPEAGIRSSCTALFPIHRKWRRPSLQLYVREIDTSWGTRP